MVLPNKINHNTVKSHKIISKKTQNVQISALNMYLIILLILLTYKIKTYDTKTITSYLQWTILVTLFSFNNIYLITSKNKSAWHFLFPFYNIFN